MRYTHIYKMNCSKVGYIFICFIWARILFQCDGFPRVIEDNSYSDYALQQLLQVFGLERNSTEPTPEPKSHPHPPQYMLDLYKAFSKGQESDYHFRYPTANTIRSFFEKGGSNSDNGYHFEIVNSIFTHEEIIAAEFHYFFDGQAFRAHPSSHIIQVLLYEESNNSSRNLLEARLISTYIPGWEVFKVTPTVQKWRQNLTSNQGFVIETLDLSGRISRTRSPSTNRPILIVFSLDRRRRKSSPTTRFYKSPRLPSMPLLADKEQALEQLSTNGINTRNIRSTGANNKDLCARRELRVDFEKLGWSSWIISPKYYDAYVCAGACAFPLGQNQRPTNHATVQSIVHELGLMTGISAPCCVPTELHSLILLYFDEHMNVVLKQYEEMVAIGCGCQ